MNVFVKPNEQNRACSSYAMARKRRMKSKDKIRMVRFTRTLTFLLKSQGRVVYYFQASMMSLKSAALSDAPPIKPPSMSSLAKSSGAFLPLQEPP